MATMEYVLDEALKLSPLDQVKLISTLAHRVDKQIREGASQAEASLPPLPESRGASPQV